MERKSNLNMDGYYVGRDSAGVFNAAIFLDKFMELPTIENDEVKPLLVSGDNSSVRTRIGTYLTGPVVSLTNSFAHAINTADVEGEIVTEKDQETLIVRGIGKYGIGYYDEISTEKFARIHKIFLLSQVVGGSRNIDGLLEEEEASLERYCKKPEYNLGSGRKLKKFIKDNRKFVLDKSFSGYVCPDIRNQGDNIQAVLSRTTLPAALFQFPGFNLSDGLQMDERYCLALEQMTGAKLDYHVISGDKGKIKCITRK